MEKTKTIQDTTFNNVPNIQNPRVNRPIIVTINRLDNFKGIQESMTGEIKTLHLIMHEDRSGFNFFKRD